MDKKLIEKTESGYLLRWGDLERELPYKPTLEIIKKIILSLENHKIDQEILSGYTWRGMSVWLSSENQFNYKAAYDLAIQTGGANLPLVFKFGDSENPVYHAFQDLQELTEFYTGALGYVNQVLALGWTRKDSISWDLYQKALDKLDEESVVE